MIPYSIMTVLLREWQAVRRSSGNKEKWPLVWEQID